MLGFLAGKSTVHLGITQHHPFRVVRLYAVIAATVTSGLRCWKGPTLRFNSPKGESQVSQVVIASFLTVGGIGTTRMACRGDVMQQERRFVQALSAAKSVSVERNSLRVEYGENVALVFDRESND